MKTSIVHVSDIHYQDGWHEEQGIVMQAFLDDLEEQVARSDAESWFLCISGDLIKRGQDADHYDDLFLGLDERLEALGIGRDRRICVPGNHDVSMDAIDANAIPHEAIVTRRYGEREFNDLVASEPETVVSKFDNYREFESRFAKFGVDDPSMGGCGWHLTDDIGVYCLNSAWSSRGAPGGDHRQLCVDTRQLNAWVLENRDPCKILVMHHPLEWLSDWSHRELQSIIRQHFTLCLSGHVHDQLLVRSIENDGNTNICSAPPLHTSKHSDLGYAIVTFDEGFGAGNIAYRQWTKYRKFLRGVGFSGTEDGCVELTLRPSKDSAIDLLLKQRRETALRTFSTHPIIWIDPVISDTSELSARNQKPAASDDVPPNVEPAFYSIADIIESDDSLVIQAPQQFGLTSLATHLAYTAWQTGAGFWLVVDSDDVKPQKIERSIKRQLEPFGATIDDVSCLVLDSWSTDNRLADKILANLSKQYPDKRLVVMQRISSSQFLGMPLNEEIEREFGVLWRHKFISRDHDERNVCQQ